MVTSQRPRVVVADDHGPVRQVIADALTAGGFDVVAQASDAYSAVEAAAQHKPDVALLDIHMPGSGIAAAASISSQLPGTEIVMLTASDEDADLFDSVRAGASGYLLKTMDHERLPEALRGVLSGEAAVPRQLVARILEEFRARPPRRLRRTSALADKLTSREWEVMELLGAGLTTDQVARRLFLSPTTVRVHVSTVLRKLRVKDRESAFGLLRE